MYFQGDQRSEEDELVDQFLRRSVDEKQRILKWAMRQIAYIILPNNQVLDRRCMRETTGPLRQKKAEQVLDILWEEEHGLLPLFEKSESFPESIMASATNIRRSDLATLNHVRAFGKCEEVGLSETLRKIERHTHNSRLLPPQVCHR
jgi:hypothetical protein